MESTFAKKTRHLSLIELTDMVNKFSTTPKIVNTYGENVLLLLLLPENDQHRITQGELYTKLR